MTESRSWLSEAWPGLRPAAESVAWSTAFMVANLIGQEPLFFVILLLVLGFDVLDFGDKRKSLLRDFLAGITITLLAVPVNDRLGLYVGTTVSSLALARVSMSFSRVHASSWTRRIRTLID